MDGPQNPSGRSGEEEKYLSSYRESKPGRTAHSLVTTLTELPYNNHTVQDGSTRNSRNIVDVGCT